MQSHNAYRQILVVEDDLLLVSIISSLLEDKGLLVDIAKNGETAWSLLQGKAYDLMIVDRLLPGMDGLTLVNQIRDDGRWDGMPIIMQTAMTSQADVLEGVNAGVNHYLNKPYEMNALWQLVCRVLDSKEEQEKIHDGIKQTSLALSMIDQVSFKIRFPDEALSVAALVGKHCQNGSALSIGLHELLLNAIEHGNLEIGFDTKNEWLNENVFKVKLADRLQDAAYADRYVKFDMRRDGERYLFQIEDQGNGFDYENVEQSKADRAFSLCGQGIGVAQRMGLDDIVFHNPGNRVTATARRMVEI